MALESKVGRDAKVTIGAHTILGLGTWTISGGAFAELDDTAFGDDSEQILRGLRSGGEVTFSGNYKKDDVTGQDMIKMAYWMKSDLTTLRFYVDDTSFYATNSTTGAGGGLPAETEVSHIKIFSEPTVSVDKGGLATIEFTGKIIGAMRLN